MEYVRLEAKMERDFMGLAVKNEPPDEINDSAPVRSLAMQWSFSNKTSPLPQLLSFQDVHEEKPKTGFDSLASTGLVSITTTEAFDSDHNLYSSVVQKNVIPEKQAAPWYRMTTYPAKHLDSRTHRSILNQENATVSPAGLHLISLASPQPLAGISMAHPIQVIPSSSSVVGTTDLRNIPKISTAPAQLTIFYAGSVCVYDNISPLKAQAIMLLAGNGAPTPSSTTLPVAPVQAYMPQSSVLDGFVVTQPYGSTPYHSGPIPITALSMSHSAGGFAINNRTTVNPGVTLPSSSKIGPMKVVNSLGSDPASANLLSSTVPQFRRKSLARFLEKRKERVIAQAPYSDNQTSDRDNPEAGNTSMSVNSRVSCPAPANC